jgi:hypothetical protein
VKKVCESLENIYIYSVHMIISRYGCRNERHVNNAKSEYMLLKYVWVYGIIEYWNDYGKCECAKCLECVYVCMKWKGRREFVCLKGRYVLEFPT